MICPPYHSVISIVHVSKDTIILISFIGSSLRPLEKKPSDEDHGPRPLQYPVVNLVLKGYHSPLNWLFVPKNNDRTLSQNNECYTLLYGCQWEKWEKYEILEERKNLLSNAIYSPVLFWRSVIKVHLFLLWAKNWKRILKSGKTQTTLFSSN